MFFKARGESLNCHHATIIFEFSIPFSTMYDYPMKLYLGCFLIFAIASVTFLNSANLFGAEPTPAVEPEAAMQLLREGNKRFVESHSKHPHESAEWRHSLEKEQHPVAIVLGCADSRVPPELIFDQGFGDLFVIRVAGNVVDTDVTGSIEYATRHLNTKLLVVLGHSQCGAVSAAVDQLTEKPGEPDEIVSLLYRIEPALKDIPAELDRKSRIHLAVDNNVRIAVERLTRVPSLARDRKRTGLKIVGAVYDMHTGNVRFLD